jgi:hypothetical protein
MNCTRIAAEPPELLLTKRTMETYVLNFEISFLENIN